MSRIASSKTARTWAERFAQCEGSNAPVAQRTQGGASLCPGLSHFAPLGRTDRPQPPGLPLGFPWRPSGDFLPFGML